MRYILTDFSELPDKPSDKIIVRKPSGEDIARIKSILPPNLYFEMNEGVLGLIMNAEATKQNAVAVLSRRFGVLPAEIAAFGDDMNDVEMLRACGTGVAVANALDEVKAAADETCGDCDEDGVARWLAARVL